MARQNSQQEDVDVQKNAVQTGRSKFVPFSDADIPALKAQLDKHLEDKPHLTGSVRITENGAALISVDLKPEHYTDEHRRALGEME
jgi:hypothetical protein